MFMLKKVLTPFLLPPGIFIISLIFTGVWFLLKKNRKAGIITLIFGCFTWALSISPVSDAMLKGLESEYGIPDHVNGDVIILLGLGVHDEAPDISGMGAPSDGYLTRIVTAVRLQKRLDIPIIASGKESSKEKAAEDQVIKRFLVDLGVPAGKIIIEGKSRDTFENAKFAQEICTKMGYKSPILVTSAWHMKRAVMTFRKVGLAVSPFPAGFITWRNKEYWWKAYLPGDFRKASIAVGEYMGLVFYNFAY